MNYYEALSILSSELYAAEMWTLQKDDMKRLEAFKIRL